MQFLAWVQSSSLSNWILTTTWVYPWTIAFHSVGMGFLVGIIAMIALRVLGFGAFSVAPLGRFLVVAHVAFVINVLTGLMMFMIDATSFIVSPTFLTKMLLVLLGVIFSVVLSNRIFSANPHWNGEGTAPGSLKLVAGITLVCWAGAIVAGRMTAYLP